MYLDSPFTPTMDTVYGVYYYERFKQPIVMTSEPAPNGYLALGECEPCDAPAAPHHRLLLKVDSPDAPTLTGTWTSADGTRTLPVTLRRVGEFVTDAPITRLQKFTDPRWPIEFMYPAGWFVSVTSRELLVQSPDPEDMVWRRELACDQGRGVPRVPARGEEPVEFDYPFFRTSSGWQVDTWMGMEAADVERYGTAIHMSSDVTNKGAPLWPSPGLFEETRHLVVSGDRWVSCTERLPVSAGVMNLRPVPSR